MGLGGCTARQAVRLSPARNCGVLDSCTAHQDFACTPVGEKAQRSFSHVCGVLQGELIRSTMWLGFVASCRPGWRGCTSAAAVSSEPRRSVLSLSRCMLFLYSVVHVCVWVQQGKPCEHVHEQQQVVEKSGCKRGGLVER